MATIADLRTAKTGFNDVADLLDDVETITDDHETRITTLESQIDSKAANYNNVDAVISKTGGSYGYLNFSSGDCLVSITVASGEYVYVSAGVFYSCSASGTFPQFSLYEDSSPIGNVSNTRAGTYSTSGEDYQYNTSIILTAPTTGTVEYSLRWKKATGAGTVYARFPYLNAFTIKGA